MSLFRLLLLNLLYHWRGNSAVALGVVVGGAVLTGALLVGDSLRGSLRDQSLRRLGWVEYALVTPRFFRQALADEISKQSDARVSPALLLQATCAAGTKADQFQIRGVTVLGVNASFFESDSSPEGFAEQPDGKALVWLSRPVAEALHVAAGDEVTLRLQKPGDVPREATLGKKEIQFDDWNLRVAAVLAESEPGADFSLRPQLEAPRNVIVHLPQLQQRLGLTGQVNALLAAGQGKALEQAVYDHLKLADWGLELHTPASRARDLVQRYDVDKNGKLDSFEWRLGRIKGQWTSKYAWVIERGLRPASTRERTVNDFRDYYLREHPYVSLQSKQLLISPAVADAALKAAEEVNLRAAPTLVYLCRIDAAGKRIAGVVAALDPGKSPPLGPFLPPGKKSLGDNYIVLLDEDWQEPHRPKPGAEVVLSYKPPESHGPTPDRKAIFRLAGYLPAQGSADPGLTPDFPGITDKQDIGAWDLPIDDEDWKQNISKEYGDRYWKEFRTTPKAYITLRKAKQLWASRFGELTSIRLALSGSPDTANANDRLEQVAKRYEEVLLKHLNPASGGFVFDPVQATALQASQGGTPFDLLFLGFSFFLILSALLLVGLLFRLNLDRRASQVGVLFAEGFTRSTVRRLLLGEGGLLTLFGVIVGGVAAIVYSRLLVQLLAALWPGGVLESFLRPHWTVRSLAVGAAGAFVVSLLTVAWVVRALGKVPPRALLAGQTSEDNATLLQPASWWTILIAIVAAVGGVVLLLVGPSMQGHEAKAGTFFGAGALFLTAGLVGIYAWTKRTRRGIVEGHGWWTIARLGVRNAARNPARSLLTTGLLASAAFLIVAVESFRRHAGEGDGSIHAPDGGFALVAESDLPLIRDLNTDVGRAEVLSRWRQRLIGAGVAKDEAEKRIQVAEELLKETNIVALRARAGDDASCLNLYQPRQPRILGVPESLIQRGGFVFSATLDPSAFENAQPWLILQRNGDDIIPAFGETNTVVWMLRSGLGKTYAVPDERGNERKLLISGLLQDSVFQSSLLISESAFLRLYPGHEGYNYFLVQPPPGRADEVREILQLALADRGFEVTPTAERLAAYLAVENTYLTTFQALGGLGLILGSLGLAVVLLRAVWERRSELALLRALGYRKATLGWLVMAENCFLLLAGLVIGTVSALLSILPQLISGEGSVPFANLTLLFAGVLLVALTAAALAVVGTLRAPIVPALRRE